MSWNVFRLCSGLRVVGSLMIGVVMGVVGLTYYTVVLSRYGPIMVNGGRGEGEGEGEGEGSLGTVFGAFVLLLGFHGLLVMVLWSYFSVVFSDPGSVPIGWKPYPEEDEMEAQNLTLKDKIETQRGQEKTPLFSPSHHREIPIQSTFLGPISQISSFGNLASQSSNESIIMGRQQQQQQQHSPGFSPSPPLPPPSSSSLSPSPSLISGSVALHGLQIRRCRKCSSFKPPRTHHCSICQKCVLKMDHHCVWVVNCVGAKNYKYFLLFLAYTFLETLLSSLSLFPHFFTLFSVDDVDSLNSSDIALTFLAFVLNLAFALSLLGFLAMHASLLLRNTTTIEAYEKKTGSHWRYDVGWRRNFEQVFGKTPLYWFLPMYSSEDIRRMGVLQGVDFPVRSDGEENS